MRALGFALVLLPTLAWGQQLDAPKVHLDLAVDEVKLIVETLGQIGCQNVTQLIVCEKARDTLKAIQAQAQAQLK